MTNIPISEAILCGCVLAPKQKFGSYFGDGDEPLSGSACVLGAYFLGAGTERLEAGHCLKVLDCYCPSCCTHGSTVADIFIHLNDDHHWSRERIAAWYHREFEKGNA